MRYLSLQSRICTCTACARVVVFVPPLMIEKTDDFFEGMVTRLEADAVDRSIGGRDPAQRQRRG